MELKSTTIQMLEKLAAKQTVYDLDNESIDDYVGGNIDDAYSRGIKDGETLLARELISKNL